MDANVAIALLALTAGIAGVLYAGERARRRKALLRWAASCGYTVVDYRQPVLSEMSPFPVTGSKAQQVFRITIRDDAGAVRSGWLLLGSALFGLRSPTAELRWDR